MKKVFLNCILLLCALIVGSGSLWATPTTYNFSNIPTKGWKTAGGSQTINSISWTYSSSTYIGNNSSRIQVGSSNNPQTSAWTIQTAVSNFGSNKKITAVSITAYTTSASATYDISAGGSSVKSGSLTTSSATYSASGLNVTSGNIVITMTGSSSSAAMYLSNISVTYDDVASSDPSSNVAFGVAAPSISYPATKTYSQEPTTAAGYSGTISYSITANTAGAIINSSTGVVTVTQGGSVTVKAIAAAVPGSFSGSEATYTLTVNDTRSTLSNEQFAWSATSADVTYGADNNIFPTLTNTQSVAITYSSSNTTAATINGSTGVITLKDYTDNTTISAIFAGNDDYKAKTVTYILNVTKAPFSLKDGVFDFVGAAEADEDYGSGVTLVSSGYVTTNKTWTAGKVTMVTSKVSGNGYRWWSADGTLRFYATSSATLSVPDGYVITYIKTTGGSFTTADVGNLSSTTWTGLAQSVTLGKTSGSSLNLSKIEVTYIPTTLSRTDEGYSTFYTPCKVEFTSSGSLKVYKGVLDGTTMNLYQYSNNVIPENKAVILKSDADITVAASSSEAGVAGGDESSLTGTLTQKDASTVTGGTLCVLGQHEGVSGFYAFTGETLAANKAYLVIPIASAPSIHFVINEENNATSIEAISATDKAVKFIENGQIFIKRDGIVYDALGRIAK